ncbi:TPA: hypothetical protein I7730_16020 [Vibrio vulnificus]|uniref:Uncharacterized protein n=1 Tax=Vibrio vulnificus TaxID=672 RepID=A0A8H9N1W1_VIBVL|nr:hypothetical protein [Vibrio vulnificus]
MKFETLFAVTDHFRVLPLRIVEDHVLPCGMHKVITEINAQNPNEGDVFMHNTYFKLVFITKDWELNQRCLFKDFESAKSFAATAIEEKLDSVKSQLTHLESKQANLSALTLESLLAN